MATATNDADEIRTQMARIRRDLHADVREVVANAEAVTDWRRYIRMYPWAALVASVAVGYLVVPRKHKPAAVAVPVAVGGPEIREVIEAEKEKADAPKRKGMIGMALGFLTPIALRAAQGYAVQYMEAWIAQQQQAMGAASALFPGQPDLSGQAGQPQTKKPF